MIRPRKAILLAAGFGKRMRPLSHHVPKCLVPVWGRPVIDHLLDQLASWGVREILVNLHSGADDVFAHLRSSPNAMRMNFSFEPEILGTGGVLRRAEWFLDDEPFWMVNADIIMDIKPAAMLRRYQARRPLALLWMTDRAGPRSVDMRGETITSLRTEHPGSPGTFTFCGLQLLSPRILSYIPRDGFSTIVEAYERGMRDGRRILGFSTSRAFWADIGTPETLLEAHADTLAAYRKHLPGARYISPGSRARMRQLKRDGVHVKGFVSLHPEATIAAGTHLENAVVLSNGRSVTASSASNAVIDAPIPPHRRVRRMLVRADSYEDGPVTHALKLLGWPATSASVELFAPRASQRQLMRLSKGRASVLLIHYDPERRENRRYVPIARFLERSGWSVPRVLHDLPDKNLALIEDVADSTLQDHIEAHTERDAENYYRTAIRDLVHLQHAVTHAARKHRPKLEPSFGPHLYADDLDVFETHFLRERMDLRQSQYTSAMRELEHVAKYLHRESRVLVHRDFQSSNIMLRGRRPVYIDFQGMRFGPASYDLASLLCDPYAQLSPRFRQRMLEYYAAVAGTPPGHVSVAFSMAAIQRLTQAIGAYGRMNRMVGAGRYTKYILPALQLLKTIVRNLDKFGRFSTLVDNAIEFELAQQTR